MKLVEIDFKLLVSDGTSTTFTTEGTYEEFKDFRRIQFYEQTELKALTIIDIYEEKIILNRKGNELSMKMEYIKNTDTTVFLTTNFNYELSMNCTTLFLEILYKEIKVVYQTETDKEQNLTHNLLIKWTNKK